MAVDGRLCGCRHYRHRHRPLPPSCQPPALCHKGGGGGDEGGGGVPARPRQHTWTAMASCRRLLLTALLTAAVKTAVNVADVASVVGGGVDGATAATATTAATAAAAASAAVAT